MKRYVPLLIGLGIVTTAGIVCCRRFCRGENSDEDVAPEDLAVPTPEDMLASAGIPEWPADDEVVEPTPAG